jgi:hypothetical protein
MQHSKVASCKPAKAAESSPSSGTGPPRLMPLYHCGACNCGSVNSTWSPAATPVANTARNSIRTPITESARIR